MPVSLPLERPFQLFIDKFDCCGWVPTIRGCLTLDLFNSDTVWGDTDKYAIWFKNYDNIKKTHIYLIACSLCTFDDSKKDADYSRTVRFIFTGNINDTKKRGKFLKTIFGKDKSKAEKTFKEKDLLIGRLSVIVKIKKKLSGNETELIEVLKELQKDKKDFREDFYLKAVKPSDLNDKRKKLKKNWDKANQLIDDFEKELEGKINQLSEEEYKQIRENKDGKQQYKDDRLYKFDVVLSRDGILFMKDVTTERFKEDYFDKSEDSIDNYKNNIPIHRLFKTSMHFIKFLFHKNYHHRDEDDTFLPASNLNPIKDENTTDRINKHQFDAFLNPIIQVKRGNGSQPNCNPAGVILYAQSFLNVLENNQLISKEKAGTEYKFLETQKKEIEEYLSERKVKLNSFIAQNHILVRIAAGFAFFAAYNGIVKYIFHDDPQFKDFNFTDIGTAYWRFIIFIGCFIIGYLLNFFVNKYHLSKRFSQKKERRNILNRKSITKKHMKRLQFKDEKGRFRLRYKIDEESEKKYPIWYRYIFRLQKNETGKFPWYRLPKRENGIFSIWYRLRLRLIETKIRFGLRKNLIFEGLFYFLVCSSAVVGLIFFYLLLKNL